MPKQSNKITVKLDLLHPQSNPERIFVKATKWALSTGRYIVIFVELIVLGAFIARFKLDADLANYKENIEQQIPYLESLKADEVLIRQTQKQLATIRELRSSSYNYAPLFKAVSDQTPQGVILSDVSLEESKGAMGLKLSGSAQNNNELATLLFGLRGSNVFSNITLANVSLDKDVINFTITGNANLATLKGEPVTQ